MVTRTGYERKPKGDKKRLEEMARERCERETDRAKLEETEDKFITGPDEALQGAYDNYII